MPTDFGFRFSTYLALGLACATLGYSEYLYLPSVTAFTVLVLVMMIVAFRRDGRNEISLETANRVGLVIGIAVIAYLGFQYFQPGHSLLDRLPLPAGLLPYLGPVFMVLIPAKLFRPKHVGDWWAMHGVGLAVVCLACVMEDDPTLAVLVSAYLVVGVWSLMLFYFRRGGGAVTPIPRGNEHRTTDPPVRVVSAADAPPRSRFGGVRARRPVSYLLAAAAAGFFFFFLTPRTDTPHWSLSMYREVGYSSDEQAPDLNKTGDLKDNRDRAFEVVARNRDGTPKLDLDPGQRWRGTSFLEYMDGKWITQRTIRPALIVSLAMPTRASASAMVQSALDLAGPDGYLLEFDLNGKRRDPVQADPVWWVPGGVSPLSTRSGREGLTWFQRGDGSINPAGAQARSRQYRQVVRPPTEPDLSPPFQLIRGVSVISPAGGGFPPRPQPDAPPPNEDQMYLATVDNYRFNPLPGVRTWTEKLIGRLVAGGQLPKEVADRYSPTDGTFPVDDFESVARAINRHFVTSGDFSYGTENVRIDKSLDPVEDFLVNTKTGSCEWYATALTLCLRSVGLPAQCVLGFKGCEAEDDGRYTVRQDHAHAWVEVLIPRPVPAGFSAATEYDAFRSPLPPPTRVWHWLSLDPTPGTESDTKTTGGITGLWGSFRAWWVEFFNDFVIRYDPERRERAGAAAEKWATNNWRAGVAAVLGLASAVVGGLVLRRYFRRAKSAAIPLDAVPEWYRSYLSAAAAAGLVPDGGETPREFARRVVAAVPDAEKPALELTDALYRVRYAGDPVPPSDHFRAAVADVVAALSTAASTARGD